MDHLLVHCPGCRASLKVPPQAAGHYARCSACRMQFPVPKPKDLWEETVSNWIEQDVEDVLDERDRDVEEKVAPPTPLRHGTGHPAAGATTPAPPKTPPAAPAPAPTPAAAPASAAPKPAAPAMPKVVVAPDLAGPSTAPRDLNYPTDLHVTKPVPHLVIRSCSHNGVVVAFDSCWLEHEGFCASMPMRCAFSGKRDDVELLSRPVVFADRSQGAVRSPQEVESRYEQRVLINHQPRDLVRIVGLLEGLPKPFNCPLLYYVGARHVSLSLQAETFTRPDGVTCQVTIPDPTFALEWLGRVNGVCGPEYELLSHEISLLQSDLWRLLSDTCRQRLNGWCTFEPRERFLLYASDADFGAADVGLAGIVVTDRRLFYRKYHHSGSFQFREPATLLAQTDDKFATLSLCTSERRTRLIKLALTELPKLQDVLQRIPSLKFEVTTTTAQPG